MITITVAGPLCFKIVRYCYKHVVKETVHVHDFEEKEHLPVYVCKVNGEKISLRAGFEPAREDPIGFQVQRLNHSAITAVLI